MDKQQCAVLFTGVLPAEPQVALLEACQAFQRHLGHLPVDGSPYSITRVVHHLDMANQELAEAWDLIEGGWKLHKRQPKPPDVPELVMELADTLIFISNVFLYLGGDPKQAVSELDDHRRLLMAYPNVDPRLQQRHYDDDLSVQVELEWRDLGVLYRHGGHGFQWEAQVAGLVNLIREHVAFLARNAREIACGFAPISQVAFRGIVMRATVPYLLMAVTGIPGHTQKDLWEAALSKVQRNFERQHKGY